MATKGSRGVDGTLAAWLLDRPTDEAVLTALREVARERGAWVAVIAPRGHARRATGGAPAALVRAGEAAAGRRVECTRGDAQWQELLGDAAGEEGLAWLVAEPFGSTSACAVVLGGSSAAPDDLARLARGAAVMLGRAPPAASAEETHTRGNLIAAAVYNLDYAAALLDEAEPGSSPHAADLRQAVRNAREAMARLTAKLLPVGALGSSAQALRGGSDEGATPPHPDGEP